MEASFDGMEAWVRGALWRGRKGHGRLRSLGQRNEIKRACSRCIGLLYTVYFLIFYFKLC